MYRSLRGSWSSMSHGVRSIQWPYLCDERAHCADASDASSWWAALRQAALRIGCGRWPARSSDWKARLGGWASVVCIVHDAHRCGRRRAFVIPSLWEVRRRGTGSGLVGMLRILSFPPFAPRGGLFGAGNHRISAHGSRVAGGGNTALCCTWRYWSCYPLRIEPDLGGQARPTGTRRIRRIPSQQRSGPAKALAQLASLETLCSSPICSPAPKGKAERTDLRYSFKMCTIRPVGSEPERTDNAL